MDKLKTVSYSQYSVWANCPKQWKLQYVDNLKPDESSIELVFGIAMHETIQEWLTLYFDNQKKTKFIDFSVLLKDRLKEHFINEIKLLPNGDKHFICNKETLQEYYEDGCKILNHLQKYAQEFFPTKGYRLLGCEVPLEFDLAENVAFRGYLDIVIYDEIKDEYHIIDLKTSKSGWYYQKQDPKKINQILLYKHFYAYKYNINPEKIFPRFIILKRKIFENKDFLIRHLNKFEPAHGKISMNKAVNSWKQFLTECFTAAGEHKLDSIVATPSKSACKYCPFRQTIHCTEGI